MALIPTAQQKAAFSSAAKTLLASLGVTSAATAKARGKGIVARLDAGQVDLSALPELGVLAPLLNTIVLAAARMSGQVQLPLDVSLVQNLYLALAKAQVAEAPPAPSPPAPQPQPQQQQQQQGQGQQQGGQQQGQGQQGQGLSPIGADFYGPRWVVGADAPTRTLEGAEAADANEHLPLVKPSSAPPGENFGAWIWQKYINSGLGGWVWQRVVPGGWGGSGASGLRNSETQATGANDVFDMKPLGVSAEKMSDMPMGEVPYWIPQYGRRWWTPDGTTGTGAWLLGTRPAPKPQQVKQEANRGGIAGSINKVLYGFLGGWWTIVFKFLLELAGYAESQSNKGLVAVFLGGAAALVLGLAGWQIKKMRKKKSASRPSLPAAEALPF